MDDLLKKVNARLQHYNHDELMALIWEFLSGRDEDDLADFLGLIRQKSHPATLELEEYERIMERRARLMRARIDALIARGTDPQQADAQLGTLVADDGAAEVQKTITRGFAGAIMSGVHVFGSWQTSALIEYAEGCM